MKWIIIISEIKQGGEFGGREGGEEGDQTTVQSVVVRQVRPFAELVACHPSWLGSLTLVLSKPWSVDEGTRRR